MIKVQNITSSIFNRFGKNIFSILLFSFLSLLVLGNFISPENVYAANTFYVSPSALLSGDGSINSPWTLQTALNHPTTVKPGDTIWLRGGTYKGQFFSRLKGQEGAPILVRQFPGEKVIIDTATQGPFMNPLKVESQSSYVTFWGFEVMNSNLDRVCNTSGSAPWCGRATGIDSYGHHIKFINLVIHDNGNGISPWISSVPDDTEVYGVISFDNGWVGPDRGHGHGIYSQNREGKKSITDNIFFNGYNQAMQVYSAEINNYTIEGNIAFNSGILQGNFERNFFFGGGVCNGAVVKNNYAYFPLDVTAQSFRLGYGGQGCVNAQFNNNYIVGPTVFQGNTNLSMTGNTFVGPVSFEFTNTPSGTLAGYPGNTHIPYGTRPSGVKVYTRPNKYEPGRGHVVVYNWDKQDVVNVDLSSILSIGTIYEIRDVQNYFGAPIVSGTYNGKVVPLLMPGVNSPVYIPVGNAPKPPHTDKEFGVFVVIPLGSASTDSSDKTAPIISSIQTLSLTSVSADIVWSTNEGADTYVEYGTTQNLGNNSELNGSLLLNHIQNISNLQPSTTYYFRVISKDANGNKTASAIQTFQTKDISFDVTAPEVILTSPVGNEKIVNTLKLDASASDNKGIARVEFLIDGIKVGEDTSFPYSIIISTLAITDGPHLVSAQVFDLSNNKGVSQGVSILVANLPTPPQIYSQYFEAENAQLSEPMNIYSDTNASGGKYVTFSKSSQNAVFEFTVPVKSKYTVWARVIGADSASDSFYVSLDNGPSDIFDVAEKKWSANWQWTRLNGRGVGNEASPLTIDPRTFNLDPNQTQKLKFVVRDLNIKLDRIVITNDFGFIPDSSKPIPVPVPGPTPVPTPTPIPTPVPTPVMSTHFSIGQRVQTTANLNVRSVASISGSLLGKQAMGSLGTVLSGGQSVDGYYWWNINYDSGADGYSSQEYLISYVIPAPTPIPTPTPAPVPTPIPAPTPVPNSTQSTPFSGILATIPGTIQFEDFDIGGPGVAYVDFDQPNVLYRYRLNESVDVGESGQRKFIGQTKAGEWMQYSINVPLDGLYTIEVVSASPTTGGTVHFEVDKVDVTGPIVLPNTGSWDTSYQSTKKEKISLKAGTHIVRFVMDTNGPSFMVSNLDYFTITKSSENLIPVPTPIPDPRDVPLPTPIITTFDMRIRAGLSTPYTGSDGKVWESGGSYTTNALLYRTSQSTTNTTEPELFKSQSFFPQGGEYKVTVSNGKYSVRLLFSEVYFNQKGSRVFDISLEENKVLQNFDVFSEAGGSYKAIEKTFTVNVSDGVLNIGLLKVVENPIINGIEIIKIADRSVVDLKENLINLISELSKKVKLLKQALEIANTNKNQVASPLCNTMDCVE